MANKLSTEDLSKMFVNPFYAITIDSTLCIEHEPMISKEEWVKVQMRLIKELGEEKYFNLLIDVLEGDYLSN